MEVTASKKIQKMATSIFTELAQKKRETINKGTDVIDLSVGSPDMPPPSYVVDTLVKYSKDTTKYGYTLKGIDEFNRAEIAGTKHKKCLSCVLACFEHM